MGDPIQPAPPTVADFNKVLEDNQKLSKFSLMLLNQLHPARNGKAEKMLEVVMKNHVDLPEIFFQEGENKEVVGVTLKGTFAEPELRLIAQAMRERNDLLTKPAEETPIIEA
jgi:hypothetical protein